MRMKNIIKAPKLKLQENFMRKSLDNPVTGVIQNVKLQKEHKSRYNKNKKEQTLHRNRSLKKVSGQKKLSKNAQKIYLSHNSLPGSGNPSIKSTHERKLQKYLIHDQIIRQKKIRSNPSTVSTFYGFI